MSGFARTRLSSMRSVSARRPNCPASCAAAIVRASSTLRWLRMSISRATSSVDCVRSSSSCTVTLRHAR